MILFHRANFRFKKDPSVLKTVKSTKFEFHRSHLYTQGNLDVLKLPDYVEI